MKTAETILYETGIIPVIQIEDAADAVPMAEALLNGGINAAEVTFRTDAAGDALRRIAAALPEMFACAGTVLTVEQAQQAVDSGAQAVISPGLNPKVVEWCVARSVPVYPGCATPSEIELAMSFGLQTVKLFPAEVVGGVDMLKALYGPYRQMRFMPTGGITPQTVGSYLALPNVIACGGSWLCAPALLKEKNFAQIELNAREAAALVAGERRDSR